MTDEQLLAESIEAFEQAESVEAEAGSTYRWKVADNWRALSERGWTQQRIAKAAKKSQGTVSKYIACATDYSPANTRPVFREAFDEFDGQGRLPRELPPPPEFTGSFPVIYADPPWRYDHSSAPDSRAIENHYDTMELADIAALDIPVADDAVLFLWATNPKLREALQVADAWGFDYRTCMVWVKDRIGMGYYVRAQHELLLIGKRGDMPLPSETSLPPSVVHAPRGKHSAKPAVFYEIIEQLYPNWPKIELFARARREGWEAWGNEAEVAA